MSYGHNKIEQEVQRLQALNNKLELLPNDLALALAKESSLDSARVDHVLERSAAGLSIEDIVKEEKQYFDDLGSKYDFDLNSVGWLGISPFLSEFTRWIRKRCQNKMTNGMEVGTAAACYNSKTEEVEIIFSPRFMAKCAEKQSNHGTIDPNGAGVNEHEHFHLLLQHVTSRRREPASLHNIATDLAINSLISRCDTMSRLPSMLLLPGLLNKGPVDPKLPKEVQEAQAKLNKIIAELPQEQASEWYFNKLKQESEKHGYEWGKKGMKVPGASKPGEDGEDEGWVLWPSDQHEGWDDIPEELRDIVDGKIKHAMRKACEKGDSSPNGWGNIPSELREEIRAAAFGSVDWKSVLKNWTGMRQAGGRSRSIKRIDRKYPLIHPGLKRSRNPNILVAVDQSGSVDDEQLSRIFGALDGCSKQITFHVLPFDYSCAESDLFTWKRGSKPHLQRVRSGGTSFDCVVDFVNRPENRGRFEGLIIASDGEAGQPPPSRVKLAWLITPNHKLLFSPRENEMLIQMNEKEVARGLKW
jgi:predicted metal-dependent peptidase